MISCLLITNIYGANAAEANRAAFHKRSIFEVNLDSLKEAGVLDQDIISLAQQIEAYNPTDVQIKNYIDDLMQLPRMGLYQVMICHRNGTLQ